MTTDDEIMNVSCANEELIFPTKEAYIEFLNNEGATKGFNFFSENTKHGKSTGARPRTKTLEFKVTFRCNRYGKKRVVDIPELSNIKRRRESIKLEDPCPCRVTVRKYLQCTMFYLK